jgi:hypothetical protein
MEALRDHETQPTTSKSEPENYTSAGVARKATPQRNNIKVERKTTEKTSKSAPEQTISRRQIRRKLPQKTPP